MIMGQHLKKIAREFMIQSSHEWWDTLTCGQQMEYLKMHENSELRPTCNDPNAEPSPLTLEQVNQIQIDEMKKYHALRSNELGYDPGPALDIEWVKLHAKKFRDELRKHHLSR